MTATEGVRGLIVGVALLLGGFFLLDCMSAVAKIMSDRHDVRHISFARNLFGLLPTMFVLLIEGRGRIGLASFRLKQWKLGLARGGIVAVAQLAYYTALHHLEMATVAAIAAASPMFVTLLAVPLLGERFGLWRTGAVLIGMAGVLMVISPGSDVFTWASVLPAAAAFCYAVSMVTARLFDDGASHALINIYGQVGAIAGSLALILFTGAPLSLPAGSGAFLWLDFSYCLLLGLFGGFGAYLLTLAFRRTQASALAPFEYFGIVSTLLVGWVVFAEWPFERIFPGILLVMCGGLIIVARERHLARRGTVKVTG